MVEQMLRDCGWSEERIKTCRPVIEALEAPPERTYIRTVTSLSVDVSGAPVAISALDVSGPPYVTSIPRVD